MKDLSLSSRRVLVQGSLIFFVSLLFSFSIGESIVGKLLGQWTLDQFVRLEPQREEDQIVLIDITEDDYEHVFDRRRPLNPGLIIQLIAAAHAGAAKLVAVDVNTADWPQDWGTRFKSKIPSGAAVVWACDFYMDRSSGRPHRRLDRLLGDMQEFNKECYGVPAFEQGGGIVRYFYSGLKFELWVPSFVTQIAHRAEHIACLQPEEKDEELRIIDFSAKIRTESASTLLEQAKQKDWASRSEFDGKILVIGGSFHSGSDEKLTPIGEMSGLQITGQALSSLLRGKARRALGRFSSVLIDAGIGFLLFVVGAWSRRAQVVLAILIVIAGGWLCLQTFHQYFLFVSFIPFVLGSFAHIILGWMYETPSSEPKAA